MPATNEPSGLLIAGIMFLFLVGWLLLIGLIAAIRQYGVRGLIRRLLALFPERPSIQAEIPAPTPRRPRRVPLRGRRGQLAGSKIVRQDRSTVPNEPNDGERSSDVRTASEREGTTVPGVLRSPTIVPESVLTVPEMLMITAALTRGVAPSDIAKSLPGYSGAKYTEYMEKVKKTQATLAKTGALGPKKEAEAPEVKTA